MGLNNAGPLRSGVFPVVSRQYYAICIGWICMCGTTDSEIGRPNCKLQVDFPLLGGSSPNSLIVQGSTVYYRGCHYREMIILKTNPRLQNRLPNLCMLIYFQIKLFWIGTYVRLFLFRSCLLLVPVPVAVCPYFGFCTYHIVPWLFIK